MRPTQYYGEVASSRSMPRRPCRTRFNRLPRRLDCPKEVVNAVTKFQIYKDAKGEYRWRLRASNGETIADGNEGYLSKDSCKHGIDLVKQQAASAEVEDQT